MDGSFFPERDVQDQRVSYVEFRQRCSADFHRLHISKTAILRIRSGSKTVRTISGLETTVAQGEFVYLRRGENLTIGNIIGDTGFYYSEGLFIDDAVISEFLSVHPNRRHTSDVRKGDMSAAFDDAFTRVVDGLVDQTLPGAFLDHRTHELLLWLQMSGATHHLHTCNDLSDRLRNLLENDLERHWKAPDVAHELGMSEATLRRALNKENTSFTTQLREARLSYALMRIQTTNRPLAEIAYECGFSSQSRLSEAFKSRFDLTPGKIRSSTIEMSE